MVVSHSSVLVACLDKSVDFASFVTSLLMMTLVWVKMSRTSFKPQASVVQDMSVYYVYLVLATQLSLK